jgi:hypothetical protein
MITVSDEGAQDSDARPDPSFLSLICSKLGGGNSKVLGIFLVSAFVITIARVFAPFEVGTDQSVQLEAAQRLVDGLGLTTTNEANHHSFDMSVPPSPGYLVQWPPGLSLIVAGFLFTGFSLLASLKIIYAVLTLIGWLGWAIIASHLLSGPLRLGTRALNVHYLLAALLPIVSTPLWRGTDIFLWGGIPFIVLLLFKSSKSPRSYMTIIFAGLLFGVLCAMRYASAFLALAAALIIFQITYPGIKQFLKRLIVFFLASSIVVLPVIAYTKISSPNSSGLPAQLTATSALPGLMSRRIQGMLDGSPVISNLVFGFPLPHQLVSEIDSRPLNYAVGLTCLLVLFCLPFILLRNRAPNAQSPQEDLALGLSFLPLSLTLFLLATRLLSNSALFGIRRYYEPLFFCTIFICYEIVSKRTTRRLLIAPSIAIIALFTGYTLIFNSLLLFIPERRGQVVQSVLSFTPARSARQHSTSRDIGFSPGEIYSWKENSRLKVRQLYEAHPEALFIVQEYPSYIYDRFEGGGPVLGRDFIDYPGLNYFKQAYTSRPIKVFWVLASGARHSFIRDADMKLIYDDPIEDTRIYESDLPAGYRFLSD